MKTPTGRTTKAHAHAEQAPGPLSRADLQERAVRGALWTLVNVAVSLPVAFVVNIVLARVLGVVDYGRLAFLSTVLVLVASVVDLGIGTGVVQFGAKAHAAGRPDEVKQLLNAAQAIRLVLFAPVMSVVIVLIIAADPALVAVAVVFGVLLPAIFSGAADCFAIENRTARGAQNAILVGMLTNAAVVVVALTMRTADSVWAMRVIMASVGLALALPFISRSYRAALFRPRPRKFPVGFWAFAIPAGASGILEAALHNRTEVLILTWMSAAEAAGVFALAFGVANHLYAPAQALLWPLVPAISGLREVDEASVARALVRTLRASSTSVALLIACAMPALAFLVPVIYGGEYASVPPVLIALGIAGGLMVMAGPVKAFALARLGGRRLLWANLLSLTVGLGLTVSLIPPLGVWGAVIGNVSAACSIFGFLLVGELRDLSLSWRAGAHSVLPFLLGAAVCAGTWLGIGALHWPPIPSALAASVAGLVLTALAMRLTRSGMSPDDVAAVLRSVPNRLRGPAAMTLRSVTMRRR